MATPLKPRIRSRKSGLPPGSLVYVGKRSTESSVISVFDYAQNHLDERTLSLPEECQQFRGNHHITWINISGVQDVALIEKIGTQFNIHPLVLEDVVNTTKRPKVEDYEDYLFVVLRMVYPDQESRSILSEQVSLIIGRDYVISFQEGGDDVFHQVRSRLRQSKGKLRSQGSDFLGYSLVDAVVDNYFLVLEQLGEEIERVEELVMSEPEPKLVRQIMRMRRTVLALRRAAWSHREVASALERSESGLVAPATRPYLRDVYDHSVEIIDMIENQRELISGQMETYLSSISNRMNSVMVVLAIVSTIFMPLTFIAGVYGMNFKFMPELDSKLGYPVVLVIMFLVAAGMVGFFKRRGWI